MIVPMSKVTVLVLETDRDAALERLRDLGVIHLEAIRPAETEDVETARREWEHVQQVLEVLPRTAQGQPTGQPPEAIVRRVWEILHRRNDITDRLEELRYEADRIRPFGHVDPTELRRLAERGVHVRWYRTGPREVVRVPDGVVRVEVARDKSAVYFALIGTGDWGKITAQEIAWPTRSLGELEQEISRLETEQQELVRELERYAGDRAAIAELAAEFEDRFRLAEARAGMGVAGQRVVYWTGYCPRDELPRLAAMARAYGWGWIEREPSPDDRVPTLLRWPRWVEPIRPLLKFVGILPGYHEVDISGAFLLFFSLFFAMLVGDAGYGALFLAASWWGRRRWPRDLVRLGFMVSGATLVWGAITGTIFGVQWPNWPLRVAWLTNEDHIKWLCFVIAVVHLSLAHLWNIVRFGFTTASLAQLGWLGITWTMFFAANTMVLDRPFPSFMAYAFAASVGLVVLFMTPWPQLKTEWFNHVMLPLTIVGNFVDVVSYIRLYAVGTASYAVADNLNRLLMPMLGSWRTALIAAVFLLVAHALNIALSLMGVMVHGVRLNTLEFSGHIGLQWTGVPYRPFRRVRGAQLPQAGETR